MKRFIAFFTLASLLPVLAEAKITRISRGEINDLSVKVTDGGCRKNDGKKVTVTLMAKNETFTYSYCSQQVLSAAMDEVYPRLQEFIAGPGVGSSCSVKTWCDAYGRCQHEHGTWEENMAELVIISDDKNRIEAESYSDIQVRSSAYCKPFSCKR